MRCMKPRLAFLSLPAYPARIMLFCLLGTLVSVPALGQTKQPYRCQVRRSLSTTQLLRSNPSAGWRSTCDRGQQYLSHPDWCPTKSFTRRYMPRCALTAPTGPSRVPVARGHLFSFAGQFRTTDMGALSACFICVRIKNLCPSGRTS